MKTSEYQKFQDFKKRRNLTNKQLATIMTDYANTVDEYSASFFSVKYHISLYEFYRIRDYTIIFMLVDAPVCKRIRDKSFRNQSGKNKSGNYTAANNHYRQLIEKRKEYLKSFPNEIIILIAIQYAQGAALYDIAKELNISTYTVRKLLAISLENHLVCDDVYELIKLRSNRYIASLHYFDGYTAENLWNSYKKWQKQPYLRVVFYMGGLPRPPLQYF